MSNIPHIRGQLDPERLLFRINSGETVAEEDLHRVARRLEQALTESGDGFAFLDDAYSLLLVLGRAKVVAYRPLLEAALECKDPFTVSMVLEILCLEWNETKSLLERVVSFALGVAWDDEDDVRLSALKILGEYLRGIVSVSKQSEESPAELREQDQHVLGLLLYTFFDLHLDQFTRQGVYSALCRAEGLGWDAIHSECAQLDLSPESKDINWEMLRRLEDTAGIYSLESGEAS